MKRLPALAAALAVVTHGHAAADPLRLRADALATTASPAGLLVLDASGAAQPGLSAEAVVWVAGNTAADRMTGDDARGDVLVIAVDAHTADGAAAARIGRFVSTLGALRPEHIDGAAVRFRLPYQVDVEAVGGVPVLPGLMTSRTWDWLAGGRIARRFSDWGSAGIAYEQVRTDGRLVTEEVAADVGATLGRHDDVGARAAYDLANPGLAEVSLTASHRTEHLRTELYASELSASHLLPATSLFSVIGDVPSERAGAVLTWAAAPRLDLTADAGARRVDADVAPELTARAKLKLDDRGASALSAELRRSGVGSEAWTGARGAARIAFGHALWASTELELVRPDDPRGRGALWPWVLAALGWDRGDWQAAAAVEASASPEYRSRVDALFQLSRRWGTP
ncbi:MAG TPA: hypothetical protein VHW23_20195 [Kofleriaceae bacterium]|nr:hypothetical protein [Kofleriaceae bacterium]